MTTMVHSGCESNYVGYSGYWWSATALRMRCALLVDRDMISNYAIVNRNGIYVSNQYGFSVRCVKGDTGTTSGAVNRICDCG